MKRIHFLLTGFIMVASLISVYAQNPIIRDQFTADPTARVFSDKVYLYPSQEILTPSGKNSRNDWSCNDFLIGFKDC